MPAIDFPAAPAVNDEYSFEGRTWRWNGTGWEVKEYPAALLAGTAANPSLYFSGDPNTGLYSPGADQVAISTGGTGRLFVDASGNVGIGTSSPDFILHTAENASTYIRIQRTTLGTEGNLYLGCTSSANQIISASASSSVAKALRFDVGSTEAVRITSTGNVGIGTSSPAAPLHVAGNIRSGVTGTDGSITLNRSSDGLPINAISFDSATEEMRINNGSGNGRIVFQTVSTERARIDSSGRLLVGTSSNLAGYDLQVVNTSGNNIAAMSYSSTGGDGAYITLFHSKSGTAGTHSVLGANDNLGVIQFSGSDGTTFRPGALIKAEVDAAISGAEMPGRLVFATTADGAASPTEAMRINNQRELLIGTTTRTANGGVLQISNGITFPGTQSACSDANTLDDYEEGTFTPTIVGTGTAGAGTYSVQVGRYTKIGQRVYFQINLTWSAHTGTTNMIVGALPFTSANVQAVSAVSIRHSNLTSPASTVVQGYVTQNATTITLESIAVAGGAAAALALDTAATLTVAGDYEAA